MTDISSMTDQQLNDALAVEVRGWGERTEADKGIRDKWGDFVTSEVQAFNYPWQPATNLNQAVECAEVLDFYVEISRDMDSDWYVTIPSPNESKTYESSGRRLSRALSIAVLTAKRGEEKV